MRTVGLLLAAYDDAVRSNDEVDTSHGGGLPTSIGVMVYGVILFLLR